MAAGIHSLLSGTDDLQIVALPEYADASLLAEIRQLAPAIVIADSLSWRRLWPWLDGLEDGSDVRLVLVDTETNRIHLCHWKRVVLRQGSDLRHMIGAAGDPQAASLASQPAPSSASASYATG